MKRLLLLISLFTLIACGERNEHIDVTAPLWDSIAVLNTDILILKEDVVLLNDSIATLNEKPLMTKEQFVKLYKYESLYKYYSICKRDPSQWVFYKGWSTRVFED